MLEFPFLYIGLRKTPKDVFKLVEKKNLVGKKPGISNCSTNQHPDPFFIELPGCQPDRETGKPPRIFFSREKP